jgi:hypothetical protein
MDQQIASRLGADLFLLHAPSVYDFRERDDMLFAYLSASVNVTVRNSKDLDGPTGLRAGIASIGAGGDRVS